MAQPMNPAETLLVPESEHAGAADGVGFGLGAACELEILRHQFAAVRRFDPIHKSAKLRRLFDYLLGEYGSDRASEISEYSIAFDCFGLGADFDPGKTSLVRVHLSRLRKALVEYAEGEGAGDAFSITLPLASYTLLIEARAPKREERGVPLPVVALIEFKAIGLVDEWQLLPAMLAEQLGNRIAGCGAFQFMGPFSRQVLGDRVDDLVALGAKHRVDCFIDGSLVKAGDQLTLHIRMIDGASGVQTWTGSEKVPFSLISLDGFHDDVVGRLAGLIGADYGAVDSHFQRFARVKPENSLSVYEAVLLGRMYFADYNPAALPKIIGRLREVIIEQPDEPLPKSTLSMLLANMGFEPRWSDTPSLGEIQQLAAEAWRLAPDDPWSILALGFSACLSRDTHTVFRLGVATEADPRSTSITRCGIGILLCLRKVDVAMGLRLIHSGISANPYYPRAVHFVGALVDLEHGRLTEALEKVDLYGLPWGWVDPLIRGAIYALQGEPGRAAGEYRAVLDVWPDFERACLKNDQFLWHRDYLDLIAGALTRAGALAGIELGHSEEGPAAS